MPNLLFRLQNNTDDEATRESHPADCHDLLDKHARVLAAFVPVTSESGGRPFAATTLPKFLKRVGGWTHRIG